MKEDKIKSIKDKVRKVLRIIAYFLLKLIK